MTRLRRRIGLAASVIGLLAAVPALAEEPEAQTEEPEAQTEEPEAQAGIGPKGCHAYQSPKNDHVAVGWCDRGNGTWYVRAKCGGPGRVTGPYRGTKGKRAQGKENASVLDCGGGYPLEMEVANVKP